MVKFRYLEKTRKVDQGAYGGIERTKALQYSKLSTYYTNEFLQLVEIWSPWETVDMDKIPTETEHG